MKKLFIIALSFFMFACSEEEDSCTPTPTLITNEPSAITDTAVTFSGTIEAPTCDPTVTSQGFVYSLNTLPKITDAFIEVNGKAISKEITGLQQNRTYYHRTYFTNPTGTYYGNEINFQTNVGAVLLNLSAVTNIKEFSADVSSYISDNGGLEITGRGVCWSINPNPTITDSKTEDGSGIGVFTSNLVGLTQDTTYNVRTYATNEAGTTYGEQISFKTLLSNIYLDANGITVKAKDGAEIGSKGTINSIVYTVVDEVTLREMIRNGVDVTNVCTSRITNMTRMFFSANNFNGDISSWDVSSVTDMGSMFEYAYDFNQDISAWDVSNVTNMDNMFTRSNFNQDLSAWDVSSVTDMSGMFYSSNFNSDISSWDVSSVTDMSSMFGRTLNAFNQDISAWDVSSVTDMRYMFESADNFNGDISSWDVSSVTDMYYMFFEADNFNSDISSWDVSSVTNMHTMFFRASNFNQDLSSWDVSKVGNYTSFDYNTPQWTLPKPNFN
jgi:surface protein